MNALVMDANISIGSWFALSDGKYTHWQALWKWIILSLLEPNHFQLHPQASSLKWMLLAYRSIVESPRLFEIQFSELEDERVLEANADMNFKGQLCSDNGPMPLLPWWMSAYTMVPWISSGWSTWLRFALALLNLSKVITYYCCEMTAGPLLFSLCCCPFECCFVLLHLLAQEKNMLPSISSQVGMRLGWWMDGVGECAVGKER